MFHLFQSHPFSIEYTHRIAPTPHYYVKGLTRQYSSPDIEVKNSRSSTGGIVISNYVYGKINKDEEYRVVKYINISVSCNLKDVTSFNLTV